MVGPAITVAVVDDHAMVREAVAVSLESAGIRVAYRGDQVEEAAASRAQVVLLDIDLGANAEPLLSRLAVLQEAGCNVLIVSALERSADVRDAVLAGAQGFVPKRADLDTLCEAIQTAASGHLYFSADLAGILASAPQRPDLSHRELTALRLWASGMTLALMAQAMGVSPHTAREYLDRVRAKYARVGRPARTRTEMFAAASADGLLAD